jgi:hypothetical protein
MLPSPTTFRWWLFPSFRVLYHRTRDVLLVLFSHLQTRVWAVIETIKAVFE